MTTNRPDQIGATELGALETIDAFVDGESTDAEALKTALASDLGRQYLVDVVTLRELVSEGGQFAAASVPSRVRRVPGLVHLAAAALVACLAGIGGFLAGQRATAGPPVASTTASNIAVVARPVPSVTVPPATIHITPDEGPGVDGDASSGGN